MFERLGWELFVWDLVWELEYWFWEGREDLPARVVGANYQRDFSFVTFDAAIGVFCNFFLYVYNYYIINRSASLFLNQPEPSQVWGREQRCVGEILGGYQICFV